MEINQDIKIRYTEGLVLNTVEFPVENQDMGKSRICK